MINRRKREMPVQINLQMWEVEIFRFLFCQNVWKSDSEKSEIRTFSDENLNRDSRSPI